MNKSVLNLEPYSVFANMPYTEPEWLWEKQLAMGSCSLFSGKPKTGKSTFVRYLISAVLNGIEFLGQPTRKSSVIYVAIEEQKQFIKKVFSEAGIEPTDNLILQVGSFDTTSIDQLILDLKESAELYDAKLIIIDTLIKAVSKFDTNDYGTATFITQKFLELARNSNAHILLIHHAKKGDMNGQESAMGSIGFSGGVDNTIVFDSNSNYSSVSFKGRYIEEKEIGFVRNGLTLDLIDLKNRESMVSSMVVKALEHQSDLTRDQLKMVVPCRDEILTKVLKNLQENKTVSSLGNGTKGSKKTYKLNSPLENVAERNRG